MSKFWFFLALIGLVILSTTGAASALDIRRGVTVHTIAKSETIDDDVVFMGETVVIDGTVNGDVMAFAESIFVYGTINGNLIAAGGRVMVRGDVTGTVYAAGQTVAVEGTVGRSLVAAGGSVVVTQTGNVARSLVAAGDRVEHKGFVGLGAAVAAADAEIDGKVSGELQASVDRLFMGAKADVAGPVTYWSNQVAQVSAGAKTGVLTRQIPSRTWQEWEEPWFLRPFWLVVKFGGFLALGLVFLALFPSLRHSFPEVITSRPGQVPMAGFLALLAVPVAAVILMVTLVGLPLGVFSLVLFPVVIYGSQVLIAWTVGKLLSERIPQLKGLAWPVLFMTGTLATSVLIEVPLFGWVASLAAIFYGLGGLYYLITDQRKLAA